MLNLIILLLTAGCCPLQPPCRRVLNTTGLSVVERFSGMNIHVPPYTDGPMLDLPTHAVMPSSCFDADSSSLSVSCRAAYPLNETGKSKHNSVSEFNTGYLITSPGATAQPPASCCHGNLAEADDILGTCPCVGQYVELGPTVFDLCLFIQHRSNWKSYSYNNCTDTRSEYDDATD